MGRGVAAGEETIREGGEKKGMSGMRGGRVF